MLHINKHNVKIVHFQAFFWLSECFLRVKITILIHKNTIVNINRMHCKQCLNNKETNL